MENYLRFRIHQSDRLNRDENSYSIVCKHSDVDRQKKYHFKKIFTSTNLNDYSPSMQTDIINKTSSDKDDYPRRKTRQSNSVNIISNRVNDDIISTQMITDALTEGHILHKLIYINRLKQFILIQKILNEFYQYKSKKNLLVCQQFFLQNLSQIFGLHIFNPLSNPIDKYAQKISRLIATKINKQGLKYSFSSKLNKNSKFKIPSVSYNVKNVSLISNSSPINLHTFCGQTYDRSTSAYTSKKGSNRQYSSYRRMKDEIDQSIPANILSRVAEKLDEDEIEYLTAPNTFKYVNKSSKYKYHSTQKQPSDSSDIYIKLSDCQAACRLVNILIHDKNSTNYSVDVRWLNIINEIVFLHMPVLIIDIEKQNYLSVIVIFLCH
jgi:hypothetical protein